MRFALALVGALLLWVAPTGATVTYEYQGNPFTTFNPQPGVVDPYTTNDYISGFFIVESALAPNSSARVTPISFSFTDGHQSFASATPNNVSFPIVTNAQGAIVSWSISDISYVVLPGSNMLGARPGLSTCGGLISCYRGVADLGILLAGSGGNSNDPGRSIAPEPSTLALFVIPTLILGAVPRRQRSRD